MARNTLPNLIAGSIGLAAVLAAGCATAPAPGNYVAAPKGTVATYHRQSTGSYGTVNGPVSWTHDEQMRAGSVVAALVSPQAGTNLLDPRTNALIATLDTAGRPGFTFDPPLGYAWPLEVGKSWTTTYTVTNHGAARTVPMAITYRVDAYEEITVPAGSFHTFRMLSTDSLGEVTQQWTAPALGIQTVRRILDRPATHPLGAGHLEGRLTSIVRPK